MAARPAIVEQTMFRHEDAILELQHISTHHNLQLIEMQRHVDELDNRGCQRNPWIHGIPESVEPDQIPQALQTIFNNLLEKPPDSPVD